MKRMVTLSVGLLALCGPSFAGPRLFVPNKGQATVAVFDQSYLT